MNAIWKAAGAAAWGAVSFGGLLPVLDQERRQKIEDLCPSPGGVFVAAFSYFAGRSPGNLALYARGEDYHRVLLRRLEGVCASLKARYPDHCFLPGADNSPIPEQAAAVLAGLGEKGQHNLLLVPPYGSYLFLGTILTDLPLETSVGRIETACTHCGACGRACPTGALSEHGLEASRCLSHLSQKKGELSPWEAKALQRSPLIWGCDLCQAACPCNRHARETELPEFRENLLHALSAEEIKDLTKRQWKERYGDRAFSWRGPSVLRRNLALLEERTQEEDD